MSLLLGHGRGKNYIVEFHKNEKVDKEKRREFFKNLSALSLSAIKYLLDNYTMIHSRLMYRTHATFRLDPQSQGSGH